MNSLGIAIIFMILVVLSNDRNYTASGEKTLDIPVNLSNTQNNITYEVHATVYGKQTIEQSKVLQLRPVQTTLSHYVMCLQERFHLRVSQYP